MVKKIFNSKNILALVSSLVISFLLLFIFKQVDYKFILITTLIPILSFIFILFIANFKSKNKIDSFFIITILILLYLILYTFGIGVIGKLEYIFIGYELYSLVIFSIISFVVTGITMMVRLLK